MEQEKQQSGHTQSWRDSLMLATAILNIIALLGLIFGGMKWIQEIQMNVNANSRQIEQAAQAIQQLQDWRVEVEIRHAQQDALRDEGYQPVPKHKKSSPNSTNNKVR